MAFDPHDQSMFRYKEINDHYKDLDRKLWPFVWCDECCDENDNCTGDKSNDTSVGCSCPECHQDPECECYTGSRKDRTKLEYAWETRDTLRAERDEALEQHGFPPLGLNDNWEDDDDDDDDDEPDEATAAREANNTRPDPNQDLTVEAEPNDNNNLTYWGDIEAYIRSRACVLCCFCTVRELDIPQLPPLNPSSSEPKEEPWRLSCGHIVGKECFRDYAHGKILAEFNGTAEPGAHLSCPICRQIVNRLTDIPPSDVPGRYWSY